VNGRLPAVSERQLIRALEKAGWHVERTRGSHWSMGHPDVGYVVVVPLHRELAKGTLSLILRDAGLSRDELHRLL
jgi:predicted RNA binding protein YcfA (HicA-like mRNA interferase family)